MPGVTWLTANGAPVRFLNPADRYPINSYQSALLAQVAMVVAYALASGDAGSSSGPARGRVKSLSRLRAVELCAGNGPAAVSLKKIGVGYVAASDIDSGALAAASENAKLNGVCLDLLQVEDINAPYCGAKYDLVVCNPPCGPSDAFAGDAPVAIRRAIDGGIGGIALFCRIVETAPLRLKHGGRLVAVLTSTMDVVAAVSVLTKVFGTNWYAFPQTPVAAPLDKLESPRGQKLAAAAEAGRTIVWDGGDGNAWRLSWIIVAHTDEAPKVGIAERLPLHPFGWPRSPKNDALEASSTRLRQSLLKLRLR